MKPTGYFAALKMIHRLLLMGLSFFGALSLVLVATRSFPAVLDAASDRMMQVVAVLLSVGMVVVGFNIFRKKILSTRDLTGTAEEKVTDYRKSCLVWWAMLEGPGLFAFVCFLLTGNYAFFALGCAHIVAIFLFTPRKENIAVLLRLSSEEVSRLEQS